MLCAVRPDGQSRAKDEVPNCSWITGNPENELFEANRRVLNRLIPGAADQPCEYIEFSPEHDLNQVLDYVREQLRAH
jgi:hypothetical protein